MIPLFGIQREEVAGLCWDTLQDVRDGRERVDRPDDPFVEVREVGDEPKAVGVVLGYEVRWAYPLRGTFHLPDDFFLDEVINDFSGFFFPV